MHPILFSVGPFTLRSYGVMMALSFLLGLGLANVLNRREGRSFDELLDLGTWIMLGAVLGARILYCIVEWPQFQAQPWTVFAVWQGGLVYYGGLIGAALTAYGVMRFKGMPVWSYADVLAPGLALGQVTGRLGCFLNGCCYGRVSAGFGLVFPGVSSQPVLPTQLYESAGCLLLALGLAWLHGHRRFKGQVFALYLILYALLRFGLELLRGDAERGTLLGLPWLSPGQWTSLLALAAGLLLMKRLRRAA